MTADVFKEEEEAKPQEENIILILYFTKNKYKIRFSGYFTNTY